MTDATDHELTIDDLARETGMTARNIRAHQSRGLLPPPEVRGRTGFYGSEHVARLELVKELQADGFNLESIKRLLERTNGSTVEVLRFAEAVRAPFDEEEPEIVEAGELFGRWARERPDPRLIEVAVDLGLLRPLGDDRFEERSPTLGRVSAELAALGIGPEETLRVARRLKRHADGAAKDFVRLFVDEVWKPAAAEGMTEESLQQASAAMETLRPIASEALLAMFQLVMTDHVEAAFGRELGRMANESEPGGRRRRRD